MKINFDTLIYLVVTIIFLAIGALGKKKKVQRPLVNNEPEDDDTMQPTRKADPFTENFNRMMGFYDKPDDSSNLVTDQDFQVEMTNSQDDRMQMTKEEILDSVESKLDVPYSKLDSVDNSLDTIEDAIDSIGDLKFDSIQDSIKMSELGAEGYGKRSSIGIMKLLDDFDIRKAIIYTEIINPKYF